MERGVKVPRSGDTPVSASAFDEEVAKFRVALTAARSAALLQLFDFLVERSNDERAPKEIEIAFAVFGRNDAPGATSQSLDSGVRVYVHRLRKRLHDFYAGQPGPRLEIPKGEYRIVLAVPPGKPDGRAPRLTPGNWAWPKLGTRPRLVVLGALLIMTFSGLAFWFPGPVHWAERGDQEQLRSTAFWRPLATDETAQLVVGDAFMVAETEDQREVQRMILEPGIRSRDDLGAYLKTHPDAFYRLYDLDLNLAPAGTVVAAWTVQNAIARSRPDNASQMQLVPGSKLRVDLLGTENLVYVGRFSDLGRVAASIFQTSHLRLGDSYNELVDATSGNRFAADLDALQENKPVVDYGYIASLPGPMGKHIFVVAGIGDAAVQNMAGLVSNSKQLRTIESRADIHGDYEALFEIRVVNGVALSQRPVFVRAIR
ncbi:hypothetical protein Y958_15255 [Nitrospirillum viridazoti CBAmc]|uniref:Uncharacterized protein n=1 Tax=Nitrospirillum viridazoti CBAmc TaxID=1441467 RepID=A0A248JUB0_9PROT|nr:hypothetical protein Y958_15255 [Nitrospirillum amazonense CBAmc]